MEAELENKNSAPVFIACAVHWLNFVGLVSAYCVSAISYLYFLQGLRNFLLYQ